MTPSSHTEPTRSLAIFLNGSHTLPTFKPTLQNNVVHIHPKSPSNTFQQSEFQSLYIADGGLNHYSQHFFSGDSTSNTFWYGDGDSLNEKSRDFLKKHPNIIQKKLSHDKDSSDFGIILDVIAAQKNTTSLLIEIFAGLGKRRDHEWANIEEIKRFLAVLPHGGACCFHNELILSTLPLQIHKYQEHTFSLFSQGKKSIEIKGAQYSGKHVSLVRPSHGLSNVAKDDTLSIHPNGDMIALFTCPN